MATNSATSTTTLKRSSAKTQGTTNIQVFNKSDVVPVIVPRNSFRSEAAPDSRKEGTGGRMLAYNGQSKPADFRKLSNTNTREDPDRDSVSICDKNLESNEVRGQDLISSGNVASQTLNAGERNVADLRFSVVPKIDGDIMMEPRPSYRHENCMSTLS